MTYEIIEAYARFIILNLFSFSDNFFWGNFRCDILTARISLLFLLNLRCRENLKARAKFQNGKVCSSSAVVTPSCKIQFPFSVSSFYPCRSQWQITSLVMLPQNSLYGDIIVIRIPKSNYSV